MPELSLALIVSAATLVAVIVLILIVVGMSRRQVSHPESLARVLEQKHMVMIKDLNAGLNSLGDRLSAAQNELFERLRNTITQELTQTRSTVGALQVRQVEELSATRETTTLKLAQMSADLQVKHDQLRSEVLNGILKTLAGRGFAVSGPGRRYRAGPLSMSKATIAVANRKAKYGRLLLMAQVQSSRTRRKASASEMLLCVLSRLMPRPDRRVACSRCARARDG
jgi:hypothetical protein